LNVNWVELINGWVKLMAQLIIKVTPELTEHSLYFKEIRIVTSMIGQNIFNNVEYSLAA
jgi:hypothetical protein